MSILADKNIRLVVQGITGSEGSFHTLRMFEYGTNIVAGVTPGKGGSDVDGIPVYNTIAETVSLQDANASVTFVPAAFAADAIMEAAEAGLDLVVCITEGIPTIDMMKVYRYLSDKKTRLIGPNCPGIISPGRCKIGIMPGFIHKEGRVGVMSRSGTLTYEAVKQLSDRGIGQSTCIGIGGDPIIGSNFVDLLPLFEEDPDTDIVLMIGEIGGNAEEAAAEYIKQSMKKPVVGFVAGRSAPPGKRMGHAGAIISSGKGGADDKIEAMREAGITISESPADIGRCVEEVLKAHHG